MLKFAAALAALLVVPVAQAQEAVPVAVLAETTTAQPAEAVATATNSVAQPRGTVVSTADAAPATVPAHGGQPSEDDGKSLVPICCQLPAGMIVQLETTEPLSSKQNRTGQTFALRLAEPIVLNGQVAIPAGTMGVGEIIHASAAAGGGKAGELSLAGRYLTYEGQRIALRGLKFGGAGKDRLRGAANVALIFSPLAFAVRGGEIEVPVATQVSAKLAGDVRVTPANPLHNGAAGRDAPITLAPQAIDASNTATPPPEE